MIYILIYFAWHIVAFSSRGWLFKDANCSAGYRRSQTMNGSNQATHILAGCLWLWHYRCHYPKCAANCNLYSARAQGPPGNTGRKAEPRRRRGVMTRFFS